MDGRGQKILGTMSDIMSLREATEIGEGKKADLKRMILRAPLAMAYLDGAGKILMLNEAGHDLLGRAGGVVCGRDFWELLGPSLGGETGRGICRRASEDPLGYKERKTFLRPDGTRIRCVMTVAALSSETSGNGAFIVELVDITEQERLADLRNEFISLVSHELRTPIASVYGSVSLVKGVLKDDPPEAISRLLDVAKRNCERLKRLADDLLDADLIAGYDSADYRMLPVIIRSNQSSSAVMQFQRRISQCIGNTIVAELRANGAQNYPLWLTPLNNETANHHVVTSLDITARADVA